MKGLFVFVLALPAILAAPAAQKAWPTTFPFETQQCTCTDGGVRRTESSCLYLPGDRLDGWCYPVVSWSPHMEDVFTDDYCYRTDPTMPKAVCKPVQICQSTLVNNSDYFKMC